MRTRLTIAAVAVVAALMWHIPAAAHRVFTSPYTYNTDALPILRSRCGACHDQDGIGGLPLLDYKNARASTWLIRQSLVSGRMPPWFADSTTPFKGEQRLTPRELDILMTWATGLAPEGPPVPGSSPSAAGATFPREWPLGPPDVIVPISAASAGEIELPSESLRGRSIRAVDLLPGTPSAIRSAEVMVHSRNGDRTLALWQAGDAPQTLEDNGAFAIPDDASIALRVRSLTAPIRVGFYFADAKARPVRSIVLAADGDWPPGMERRSSQRLDHSVRLLALRPVSGPLDATVRLVVVDTHGTRAPLARLQLREGWARRYIFETAIQLDRSSTIEADITPSQGIFWTKLTGDRAIGPAAGGFFRLALEVID